MFLGLAGLICFLELWSLAAPIAIAAIVVSALPAAAGYLLWREAIARRLKSVRMRSRIVVVLACITIATLVIVAYAAWDQVQLYDTGLYHLQAVKWARQHAAVPGLANVHMRFGYNNSIHLFGAYADGFWEGTAAHVANGFLLAAALAHWFTEIFWARTPRGRLRQVYCLLTLPFLLSKLWGMEVASLSTDLPLAIFALVIVLELLSFADSALVAALIAALAAVATTTKLGGLPFLVIACLLVPRVRHRRARMIALALPTLLVVAWVIRGVITSGWLLYPVFGRLPLRWAVPDSVAAWDLGNIESWSRMFGKTPDEVFGHGVWHWLGPWLETFRTSHEMILLVVAAALLAWRCAHGPSRSAARRVGEWSAITACVLGLAQWFYGAPDLRYGGFLFWILPAVLFAPMIAPAMRDATQRALVLAFSLVVTIWAGGFAFHQSVVPKLWGRPLAPRHVATHLVTTAPSTELIVPNEGDQCWDEPIPCTALPHEQTRRDPSDIGAGFLPSAR